MQMDESPKFQGSEMEDWYGIALSRYLYQVFRLLSLSLEFLNWKNKCVTVGSVSSFTMLLPAGYAVFVIYIHLKIYTFER